MLIFNSPELQVKIAERFWNALTLSATLWKNTERFFCFETIDFKSQRTLSFPLIHAAFSTCFRHSDMVSGFYILVLFSIDILMKIMQQSRRGKLSQVRVFTAFGGRRVSCPGAAGNKRGGLLLPLICHTNCSSAQNELGKIENATREIFSEGFWVAAPRNRQLYDGGKLIWNVKKG